MQIKSPSCDVVVSVFVFYTLTIRVRIPLKSRVKLFKKNKIKSKEAGDGSFKDTQNVYSMSFLLWSNTDVLTEKVFGIKPKENCFSSEIWVSQ